MLVLFNIINLLYCFIPHVCSGKEISCIKSTPASTYRKSCHLCTPSLHTSHDFICPEKLKRKKKQLPTHLFNRNSLHVLTSSAIFYISLYHIISFIFIYYNLFYTSSFMFHIFPIFLPPFPSRLGLYVQHASHPKSPGSM